MEDADIFEESGYLLVEALEGDGWGGLFRARYVPHDREVLLRAFPRAITEEPGAWRLMLAEIQAWARLDHPGVLQVLDWGKANGRCFAATRPPRGEFLGSLLSAGPGIEGADEAFKCLLAAVEAARRWGVLHLGLGPTNICVSSDRSVEVSDFGFWYVSWEFGVVDSPGSAFPAPEQISVRRASAASDVYSLSAIYIALRYGLQATRAAVGHSALPQDLDAAAAARALDPQPLARYRSAGELASALEMQPADLLEDDYRDCPLCRLRQEIQRESSPGPTPWETYVWSAIIVLAIAAALVWWLALR